MEQYRLIADIIVKIGGNEWQIGQLLKFLTVADTVL